MGGLFGYSTNEKAVVGQNSKSEARIPNKSEMREMVKTMPVGLSPLQLFSMSDFRNCCGFRYSDCHASHRRFASLGLEFPFSSSG
jgi:hypothetical protein